ncbi:YccF domain-containing protein [Bacteroidota bacterium]
MRTLGNILWHFPFFGFVNAFMTFLIGGILILTVVGAPLGLGLVQLSKFLLTPFSKEMVSKNDMDVKQNELWKIFGIFVRIIYFPFGLFLSIVTIVEMIGLFVSIVGIPVGLVLAKSMGTFFNPVNKVCVSRDLAAEIQRKK